MSSPGARPIRLLSLVFALIVTAAGVVACSGGGGGGGNAAKLPLGETLLQQSAAATRSLTSMSFAIRTQGDPNVTVRSADAKLLRNGNAQGSLTVIEVGLTVQLDFVVIGKTVHLKGPTGGWQTQPLARVAGLYDPSAILDPNRGLVQVLQTAKNASTKAQEKVAGQDSYRVSATLAKAAVSRLVPGVSADTPADLWIATATHRLLKIELRVPAKTAGKTGTVTVTFADFGAPFTIAAPS